MSMPYEYTTVWNDDKTVEAYAVAAGLFAPEQAVVEELHEMLSSACMLDIGVGGGRTTAHLLPLVKQYVGIDCSPKMIEVCNQKFHDRLRDAEFRVADVCDLGCFEDESFDCVFFSYNGLDCVGSVNRTQALAEINRVCKKDGCFCFSAHNLNSIDELFAMRFTWKPMDLLWYFKRYFFVRKHNHGKSQLRKQACADIFDGTTNFMACNHYIKPAEQIRQLCATGFDNVRVFALNGSEVDDDAYVAVMQDPWIYYVCQKVQGMTGR